MYTDVLIAHTAYHACALCVDSTHCLPHMCTDVLIANTAYHTCTLMC